MAKSFIDVVQNSPRTGLGIPTSCANQRRNKKNPPPVDADSQVRPRRRTVGAGSDAIYTGPHCCRALQAHRAPSSSSPG